MRLIRAVAIMLALTVTITLVGCVSYVDLSDRAIVQAIVIDYLPDKKVYRISMQYFNQSSEGGQNQIDKTQDNVLKMLPQQRIRQRNCLIYASRKARPLHRDWRTLYTTHRSKAGTKAHIHIR